MPIKFLGADCQEYTGRILRADKRLCRRIFENGNKEIPQGYAIFLGNHQYFYNHLFYFWFFQYRALFDGGNVFEIFSSSFVFKFSIRHSSNFYRYANGQFSLSEFEQFHRHWFNPIIYMLFSSNGCILFPMDLSVSQVLF